MDQSHFESGDLVALPRTPNKGLGYVLSVPEPGVIQVEFPFDDIEFVHLNRRPLVRLGRATREEWLAKPQTCGKCHTPRCYPGRHLCGPGVVSRREQKARADAMRRVSWHSYHHGKKRR
jgi:hypothetical protein